MKHRSSPSTSIEESLLREAKASRASTAGTDVDAFASLTQAEQFYSNVLRDLLVSDLPFMIGGGYAVNLYTHARCPTKDLDIFTTAAEFPRLLSHLQRNNRVSADESFVKCVMTRPLPKRFSMTSG